MPPRPLPSTTALLPILLLHAIAPLATAQGSRELFVDLDGRRVHAVSAGEGTPVVVFEAGMGEDLATWRDVQPAIARLTRTVTYDRPGLGRSDPASSPRDARTMARELRATLRAAGIPGPFVLVGHSLGGWVVGLFAHEYPEETAGLVLVDPAYQEPRLRAAMSEAGWRARERALSAYDARMSPAQRREKEALDLSGRQALGAFPLPDVPTVVLTGTRTNPAFPSGVLETEIKLRVHREWVARVPGAEHVVVPDARHYLQNEVPGEVISAIRHVLERTGERGSAPHPLAPRAPSAPGP